MCRTRHMQQRMSQRGITSEIVKMVGMFGICNNDRITLTGKNCEYLSEVPAKGICNNDRITLTGKNCEYLSEVPAKFKRTLDKMAQKGGCTVVNRGRSLITAFRVDSFNRNLAE